MIKRIIICLILSLSYMQYSYAESYNSNMYGYYLENNKLNTEKVLNDLSESNLEYSSIGEFLSNKNTKIKPEDIQALLDFLEKDTKIAFKNKLMVYLRFYNNLNENLKKEVKSNFESTEKDKIPYINNLTKFFNFIPQDIRNDLTFYLLQSCSSDCYNIGSLLTKEFNHRNIEYYVNNAKNNDNKDFLISSFYYSLDENLENKIFLDIKDNVYKTKTINTNLLEFILEKYSVLPQKYLDLLDYGIKSDSSNYFVEQLSFLNFRNKELYKNISNELHIKLVNLFIDKIVNKNLNIDINKLYYLIENYNIIDSNKKKKFQNLLKNNNFSMGYSNKLINDYKKIDKEIKGIIFNKIILTNDDINYYRELLLNTDTFSEKEVALLEKKIVDSKKEKEYLSYLKSFYEDVPEYKRIKILKKYYKNNEYNSIISDLLTYNYNYLSKESKNILFSLLDKNIGLDLAFNYSLNRKNDQKLVDYLLKKIKYVSTQSLIVTFFESNDIFNDNELDIFLKEISNRNDIKNKYIVRHEDDPDSTFFSYEEFEKNRKLFNNDKLLNKILKKTPKINKEDFFYNSYNRFDDFSRDGSLIYIQKVNILKRFIKDEKFLNEVPDFITQNFKEFKEEDLLDLVSSMILTKKYKSSHFGSLLLKNFDNTSSTLRDILIKEIYKDKNNTIFLSLLMFNHFNEIPKDILNKHIDTTLSKYYINNSTDIEKNSSESLDNSISEYGGNYTISVSMSFGEQDYQEYKDIYFISAILKNKEQLNDSQKNKLKNLLFDSEKSNIDSAFYNAIIYYLPYIDNQEKNLILDSLLNSKNGKFIILQNIYNIKDDPFNLIDKTEIDYINRQLKIQEILSYYINKIINSEIKNTEQIFSFIFPLEEKETHPLIKEIVLNHIKNLSEDKFKNFLKLNNFRKVKYIQNSLVERILKDKIYSKETIEVLIDNYNETKSDNISNILQNNLDKVLIYLVTNYINFNDKDTFIDLSLKNNQLNTLNSFVLLTNWKNIDKDLFNTRVNKLWFSDKNSRDILIYPMIYNNENLSKELQEELNKACNDNELSKHIANALIFNDVNIDDSFKNNFLKTLKQQPSNTNLFVKLLVKNYNDLDTNLKKTFFKIIENGNFNISIIEELIRENKPLSETDDILSKLFKNKDSLLDYVILRSTNDFDFLEEFISKYSKEFMYLKSVIDTIYSDKIKKESFDTDLVFNEPYLSEKIVIYKYFNYFSHTSKNKIKDLLFSEKQYPKNVSLGILFRGYNENANEIENYSFSYKLSKIILDEIKFNSSFISSNLLKQLFLDEILKINLTKELINSVNDKKIDNKILLENIDSLINLYVSSKKENSKILASYLDKNIKNKDIYRDNLINILIENENNYIKDNYSLNLKVSSFLELVM